MAGRAFVVRKRVPREVGPGSIPDPRDQYWASFDSRPEAEAHALGLHRAEVVANGAAHDPFADGYAAATRLPPGVLRDRLMRGHNPSFQWHHDRDEYVVVELQLQPEG